eukprot:g4422.t1
MGVSGYFFYLKRCSLDYLFDQIKGLPIIRQRLEQYMDKVQLDIQTSLKQPLIDNNVERLLRLPKRGRDDNKIILELQQYCQREEGKWQDGLVSGGIYHGGDKHLSLCNKAYSLYTVANPLHPDIWPSIMKFDSEIVAMTASILRGNCETVCGTTSSGGTESIFLSCRAHKGMAFHEKGISEPEIVVASTVHAAFDKACEIMGIRLIHVPVDERSCTIRAKDVRRFITSNTILIVGSAPSFPQGSIDPISDLSALAIEYNIGLHVDCCLGGFILPFAKQLGYPIPEFDFSLKGVTAMSVDTHKYGYSAKGTSVVLYRNRTLRRYQYFTYPRWTGGLYATACVAGSRPGALLASTWAAMVSIGEEGYLDATDKIMKSALKVKHAVAKTPGIEVLGNPDAMIVAFHAKRDSATGVKFNIYTLSDNLTKKGWNLNTLQSPASIHLCVTMLHTTEGVTERFAKDLYDCATALITEKLEENKKENNDNNGAPIYGLSSSQSKKKKTSEVEGNAPIYGMAGSLPAGPLSSMLCRYIDATMEV